MMLNALFVYGTLRPGCENEEILSGIDGTFVKATVRGVHYPNGWIEGFPYPGIEVDENGEEIAGYVFTSSELVFHLGRLDAFEGPNYKRIEARVFLENGNVITAYMYVIHPNTKVG